MYSSCFFLSEIAVFIPPISYHFCTDVVLADAAAATLLHFQGPGCQMAPWLVFLFQMNPWLMHFEFGFNRVDYVHRHRDGDKEPWNFLCSLLMVAFKPGTFSFTFLQINCTGPSLATEPRPPGYPFSYSKCCCTSLSLSRMLLLVVVFTLLRRCIRMPGLIASLTETKTANVE